MLTYRPFFATAAAAFLLVTGAVGCSSAEPESNAVSITKSCKQSACEEKKEASSGYCSRCLSACSSASYSCNPSTACTASCSGSNTYCTDDDRARCVSQSFELALPHAADAEVEAACRRSFAHVAECELATDHDASVCATWAKVERPEVAKTYDCTAKAACADLATACPMPETTFGDELCDALEAKCESATVCGAAVRTKLNGAGGWLRDDVKQVAMGCASQDTCNNAQRCFQGWADGAQL
jgi:hypothetical protein